MGHVLAEVRLQRRLEDKNAAVLLDYVRDDIARAGLKTTIGNVTEAKADGVVRGGLLGIADSEGQMVEAVVYGGSRLEGMGGDEKDEEMVRLQLD